MNNVNYFQTRDLTDEEWLKLPKEEILQLYKNCYAMLQNVTHTDFYDPKPHIAERSLGEVLIPESQGSETGKDAVKFLLDNNCGDLVLNEQRHKTEKVDRIYASDIMTKFLNEYRNQAVPEKGVTDEEIEKKIVEILRDNFPIKDSLSIPQYTSFTLALLDMAKWMRSQLQSDKP